MIKLAKNAIYTFHKDVVCHDIFNMISDQQLIL